MQNSSVQSTIAIQWWNGFSGGSARLSFRPPRTCMIPHFPRAKSWKRRLGSMAIFPSWDSSIPRPYSNKQLWPLDSNTLLPISVPPPEQPTPLPLAVKLPQHLHSAPRAVLWHAKGWQPWGAWTDGNTHGVGWSGGTAHRATWQSLTLKLRLRQPKLLRLSLWRLWPSTQEL